LLTYFALQAFSRRKPYKHLDNGLQNDIKAFFGDYPQAISQAQLTLQTLVTVRDRAVEAYQEVIRMPI
jgi:flagellar hook-basal body complex protein FliE